MGQSYARPATRLAAQVGRYAHAKQFERMRKALRTLRRRRHAPYETAPTALI